MKMGRRKLGIKKRETIHILCPFVFNIGPYERQKSPQKIREEFQKGHPGIYSIVHPQILGLNYAASVVKSWYLIVQNKLVSCVSFN